MLRQIVNRIQPMVSPMKQPIQYIATTAGLQKIFTVQSSEDFDERVRKSKTPVVIDFHAT